MLRDIVNLSNNIVFFGGAGVSTESGIPDFRSQNGLYNQKYAYPPEVILSNSFFLSHTEEFYEFYREKMLYLNAKPNPAHIILANLEKKGKLKAVITQNIDGLHQSAGSKNVLELHGSIHRNYCIKCHKYYPIESIIGSNSIPYCSCGGIIKPDVVLYEESLDSDTLKSAINYIEKADVLIVGGTSLNVYPAAGLINYYHGKKFVLINKSKTAIDNKADYIFSENIGAIFSNNFDY